MEAYDHTTSEATASRSRAVKKSDCDVLRLKGLLRGCVGCLSAVMEPIGRDGRWRTELSIQGGFYAIAADLVDGGAWIPWSQHGAVPRGPPTQPRIGELL